MPKHYCSGNRKGGPEYTYGTCMSPGTILRDGKWYCWRHTPPDSSIVGRTSTRCDGAHSYSGGETMAHTFRVTAQGERTVDLVATVEARDEDGAREIAEGLSAGDWEEMPSNLPVSSWEIIEVQPDD